jgi:hypothetical protein
MVVSERGGRMAGQSKDFALSHYDIARKACNNAILITGNGRSGTTILGKIIHSMQNVEYVFEPPLLVSLLPLISKIAESHFRLLVETYCFDELLLGQITGRGFNFNRNDDSCINLAKPQDEIDQRMAAAWSKTKAIDAAKNSRLLIKLPELTSLLPALRRLYPTMTFIVTRREPNSVIQSVIGKGWYKDATLQQCLWPSQTVDFLTPFWVAPEDIDSWRQWSELERAAYYYIRNTEGATDVEGTISVAYERLVANPDKVVRELADQLGLEFGALTPQLISETYARSEPAEDWVAQLPCEMRDKIRVLSEQIPDCTERFNLVKGTGTQ